MDIIASHQQGLIEQLEAEAVALAGRGRDSAQRAVVCHHVADMLGLSHGYALLAAHGALDIDPAIAAMERAARRSWWGLTREQRHVLGERIAVFREVLRQLDGERCAGLLMAYRLVATPGLGGEAAKRLEERLRVALAKVVAARGEADYAARRALFDAHLQWAEDVLGERLDGAIADLAWPLAPRLIERAVAAVRISVRDYERGARRNFVRSEQRLRAAPSLPASFAANPAQAFFALQRQIAERRRRAVDVDDLSPDEAVRLVA
jgi:hypothetical protein